MAETPPFFFPPTFTFLVRLIWAIVIKRLGKAKTTSLTSCHHKKIGFSFIVAALRSLFCMQRGPGMSMSKGRGFGNEARLRWWSASGDSGYLSRRMLRLETAWWRTAREKMYASSERGHEVSKCESEGCR